MDSKATLDSILSSIGQSFDGLEREARRREQDPGPAGRRDRVVVALVAADAHNDSTQQMTTN